MTTLVSNKAILDMINTTIFHSLFMRLGQGGRIGRALVIAMVGGAALLTGCGMAPKKPTIEVADVRVANFDRETAQFTVTLRVSNPNSTELTMSELKAKLFLADQEVGTAEGTQPKYVLPANSTIMLPVRVSIAFKTLPDVLRKSLVAIVSGGLPYKVSGSVTTFNGLLTIPFERSGDLGKPRS
jgi:LEA14-like dessication related protein